MRETESISFLIAKVIERNLCYLSLFRVVSPSIIFIYDYI